MLPGERGHQSHMPTCLVMLGSRPQAKENFNCHKDRGEAKGKIESCPRKKSTAASGSGQEARLPPTLPSLPLPPPLTLQASSSRMRRGGERGCQVFRKGVRCTGRGMKHHDFLQLFQRKITMLIFLSCSPSLACWARRPSSVLRTCCHHCRSVSR